jgi:hypothetical protein
MKWFRKSLFWMSVAGSFSANAAAQEPLPLRPAPRGVTLGRPAPLPTSAVRIVAETPASTAPVRLTSYSAPPARTVRALSDDEPKTLLLPRDVPPLEENADTSLLAGRPAPLRWLFRPVVALQAAPEAGKIVTPAGNPDVKIFVAPSPQPAPPAQPLDSSSAPVNPWTGVPVEGPLAMPSEGALVDAAGMVPGEITDFGGYGPGQGYRFYLRGEYLLWWTRGFYLPPLVETGPANVPESIRGAPGAPGTALLFGNGNTPSGPRSGARFTAGWYLDPCGLWAIEASGFFLGPQTGNFAVDSSQFPVLARPIFNVNTGMPDRQLTSTPGLLPADAFQLRGAIAVNDYSNFYGAEANIRRLLCCGCNYNLSALAGFRYLNLNEGLTIQENVNSFAGVQGSNVFNPGNQFIVTDSFQTRNQFYGGQLGLSGEVRRGRLFFGGTTQLGLGSNHQTITIAGSQTLETLAGARQTFNGGLLALPSNSGTFSRDQISFVPQVGFKIGYAITNNLRAFVGYDFLYWTNVVRPGDQINMALNTNQIPNFNIPAGSAPATSLVTPTVPFRSTGFWAEGISAGLEFRY